MTTSGPGWRTRLYRVEVGLGTGETAATVTLTLEGPEYIGPFGSLTDDETRRLDTWYAMRNLVQARFPLEGVTLVSMTPVTRFVRPAWDRLR